VVVGNHLLFLIKSVLVVRYGIEETSWWIGLAYHPKIMSTFSSCLINSRKKKLSSHKRKGSYILERSASRNLGTRWPNSRFCLLLEQRGTVEVRGHVHVVFTSGS
jgi:hypothetical protein